MNLYKGILIHRRSIGDEFLDVVDDGPFRSLHFNSLSIQSRMQRSEPARLVLEYTRAMMLALAFVTEPKRVLMIGLGGGSQVRFLLEHFPDCEIDAVEVQPAVTELAHRFFSLPHTPRLQIHHMDAAEFISKNQNQAGYDLILIDAFDRSGPVASIFEEDFLHGLRALMNPGAVTAINMWKTDVWEYMELCATVGPCMQTQLYDVSLKEDPENLVMLIPLHELGGKDLLRNCKRLEKKTGIKLVKHLERLARLGVPQTDSLD